MILALLTGLSCSDSPQERAGSGVPPGYTDQGDVKLEQTLRIGEATGAIFGGIVSVVASADGQIYVADHENTHIRVFSPRGDSLTTIGREGEGPGEFIRLSKILVTERGIAAFDWRQRRITIFSYEAPHEVRSTMSIPVTGERTWPRTVLFANSEGFKVTYSKSVGAVNIRNTGVNLGPDRRIAQIDTAGRVVRDSLLVVPGSQHLMKQEGAGGMYSVMPFARTPRFAVRPDGSIYYGRTDSLRIERYSPTGEHLSTVRFPYEYVPVSEAELDSLMSDRSDWAREALLRSDAVGTRPAFEALVADDQGRLWIDVTGELSDETTPWKVVDVDEQTVRETELPENVSIEYIRDGKVYGVHTDEYGVDEVVVYRILSVPA